jgi:hypothetical protein
MFHRVKLAKVLTQVMLLKCTSCTANSKPADASTSLIASVSISAVPQFVFGLGHPSHDHEISPINDYLGA